jgi:uncharacterized protein (TIGR02246 family)
MDTAEAAQRWAERLREAWPSGTPEAFLELYADDAVYRTVPGETVESGREHMRGALALGEPHPDVWVGEPVVADDRAVVEWWTVITIDGAEQSFAGSAWVRFGDDGLIVEEHDYWRQFEGRVEPWPGWGGLD